MVITACFTCPAHADVDALVTFNPECTEPKPLNKLNFLWSFGDGTESTLIKPAKAYKSPGHYSVILVVRKYPDTDKTTRIIHITSHEEVPITDSPYHCVIAFLFGATVLAKLFPYLRIFRNVYLPNSITSFYYHISQLILGMI